MHPMRTTLDLDDDVLAAAKERARSENITAGQWISRLLRQTLTGTNTAAGKGKTRRNAAGFRPFPARGVVTNELVNALRDKEGV